jgi:hypothetical protein
MQHVSFEPRTVSHGPGLFAVPVGPHAAGAAPSRAGPPACP